MKLNVCYFCLFLKSKFLKVKGLPHVYSWQSKGWHDTMHTWPAVTLQHRVSRSIQLCSVIGVSTCQLQVGRSWVSRALSTPAERTGRLMQSQTCFSYPRHVSSRLQISAGVKQCYYLGSSCAELRT